MSNWQYTPFIWPLALSALLAVFFAISIWPRRRAAGALAIFWLTLGAAEWCITYALRLSVTNPDIKLVWGHTQFIGMATVCVTWFIFGAQYSGQDKYLTKHRWLLLLIVPVLTFALLWTNDRHGLMNHGFWSDIPRATTNPSLLSASWFWVSAVYFHGLILAGTFFIAKMLARNRMYIAQITPLLIGVAIPWILNILHLVGINPIAGLDLTPSGFVISGILVTWSLFRFRFLDLMPIAHSTIMAEITDGILVLDTHDRIVELNPVARRLVNKGHPIGQPVNQALAQHPALLQAIKNHQSNHEVEISKGPTTRCFDVQISPLGGGKAPSLGSVVTWRDVSQFKQVADELRTREQFLSLLNEIATKAMENPDLPSMLQFAADRLLTLLPCSTCLVTLWDQRTERPALIATSGQDREGLLAKETATDRIELIRATLDSDRPLILSDTNLGSSIAAQAARRLGIKSLLAVAMIANGERLGAVLFLLDQAYTCSQAEAEKSRQAVTQLALAIHKTQLLLTAQKRNMELRTIHQASLHLSSSLELQAALESLLEHALQLVHAGDAHIFLYDGQRLTFQAALWAGERQQEPFANPRQDGLTYMVARAGKSIVIQDARDHELFRDWQWHGSIAGFPLRIDGRVVGVMNVASNEISAFDEDSLRILELLADQAAIAVRNAQLFAEIRAEATRRQTINAVATAAANAQSLEGLLQASLDKTLQALDLGTGCICIQGTCVAKGSTDATHQACQALVESSALTHTVAIQDTDSGEYAQREPALAANAQTHGLRAHGLRSLVLLPIESNRMILGHIGLADSAPRQWPAQDIEMLQTIGQQIGDAAQRLLLLAKVREQAQQLERIMHAVPDGVILLDENQRVVLANMIAEDYLHVLTTTGIHDKLEVLGNQSLDSLLAPYQGMWQEIISGRRTFEIATRSIETGPLSKGQVVVLHEVTEARRIQAQAQQQEQLAAVGRLAAGIAHDFNNLLTGTIGLAELLLLETEDAATATDLQSIIDQGQRGAHLIRQILDFSRQSVSVKRPLALGPFLKELTKFWQRTIPENIELELAMEQGQYDIHGDPSQIQEALTNVVLNAQDAMPGGGRLTIRLYSLAVASSMDAPLPNMQPGEWISISISDTGHGMSAEVQSRLFEPFFTTKPVGSGTGLGLAQVYGIVTQHQGKIDISSAPNRGTTITIFFPLLTESAEQPSEAVEIQWGHGECVLLVEDDPVVLTSTTKQLESLGYQVITARNGREALEAYRLNMDVIDLVLSDMVMPEMGASELYHALQQEAIQPKMIVTSGYPLDNNGARMIEQGVVDWLQKPFAIHQLAETLYKALSAG